MNNWRLFGLSRHITENVIPRYTELDAGHDTIHVSNVITRSMWYGEEWERVNGKQLDIRIALAAAAYHDLGIPIDRYNHAEESVKILKKDPFIIGHFTVSEISIISETILRHRSKYHGDRGSVYGQLLADADKEIDPVESVRRLWGYRMNPNNLTVDQSKRYGTMSDVEKIDDMLRFIQHLYASNDQTYEFELNLPIQKELMAEVIRHMLDTRWVLNVLDNIRGI